MVNASIKYLWGIESGEYTSPEYVTLTWSSTLVKFESDLKNISVLIDYWIFQWWRADDEYNKKVDEEAMKSDFIVLTHAHLDHSWRVPLLVKNGYDNPIYMTKLTALQSEQMLLDFVKVARAKMEEAKEQNEKIEKELKRHIFIVEAYEKLKSKISKQDREKIKWALYKKFGENYNLEALFTESKAILEEEKVFSIEDIKTKLETVTELLYDETDIANMMSLVHILEVWDEEVLNDFFYIDKYNKKTLEYILDKILKWYEKEIFIDNSVFNKIKDELSERIAKTKKVLEENTRIKKDNEKLSEELDEALNFVLYVDREQSKDLFDEYSKKLKKHGIKEYSDIEDALEKPYKVKYSLETLEKVSKLLKVKVKTWDEKNKRIIDSIKLNFLDAGHIEWSVQALITVVTESVNIALRNKKNKDWFGKKTTKHTNLLFSWDLWRIKNPNLSWRPEVSSLKLDYAQYETTYAWRNHPNREQTEKEFLDELSIANWKVIVPTFSMQRTQEILMLLIEDMYKHRWDKDELDKLKLELKEVESDYNSIENKNSVKAKQLFRTIEILKDDIKKIKKSSYFFNIVLDSPLSEKITNIYINELWEKYDLLDPGTQIELFGREVITYIKNKKEQKELYSGKRAYRKEIIISSSGMCEWWAVVSHLQANLENSKSTVVFVWYTPPNCRGWLIKEKKDVSIEWEVYKVSCNVVDIKWFSWHIDEEELLQLLSETSINRWAKVSLTHWTDSRLELREKIKKEVLRTRKSIDILVPELWDTVKIKI